MTYDTKFSKSRRTLLQGAGLALSAGLAGLGGLATPGIARAATGTRNTDTVRLTWGPSISLSQIAHERHAVDQSLAKQGIKVEWVGPFMNHAASLQAVVGGSADFGFWGSTTPALAAIIAGSPFVFVEFNIHDPRSSAILVKKSSGINSVKDLAGKRVAVNRSGLGEFLLVAALEKHGVDRKKVGFVYLNPGDAAPAFGQGKVDAWSMWSPGVDIARNQFDGKDIFFESRDLDALIDFDALVTTRGFATKNSALVRSVIEAYRAEAAWASDNLRESETIAQQGGKYNDAVRDYLIGLKRRHNFHEADDAGFIERFQWASDWLSERKVLPKKVKVTDYIVKV